MEIFNWPISQRNVIKLWAATKNRYIVVSFFGLLIKVMSYKDRMLTMDGQPEFRKDKYCWVKVNGNMRNHLIKGGKVYEMMRT
jgi:hypothetical protein